MKKNLLVYSLLGLALSLALGTPLVLNQKSAERVDGYSASPLPTTIDLNDTSAANIRSYYSALNSLDTSQRQGTNLLKNLKTILKNGQKYYSYDSGSAIWQIYEIADRDWDKSPASSTTYGTYNSGTNKITGYTYGTSSSSSKNNPYIHALYINRDVTNQTNAWDDHQQTQWGINREHVWPKSQGFDSGTAAGARGDPMHLMAGNGYANNIHSNYFYGYVKSSGATDCGTKYSNLSGNLKGTSKTLNTGTVFEPQDCDKGDIARAIFYMAARYNYLSGSDSDGIDSNNPNLEILQSSAYASSGYTSSASTTGKMGILTDLLAWHHADPVDQFEIHRNNLLYTNYTNNRNPFIDFPEWADYIWGTATYNGSTYQSYSSTPTGYATPSSDTINGYNSGGSADPVSVTGVSLAKATTTIEMGSSEVLSYTISPSNATNQAVTWTSSNTSVATVSSSGRVEGVSEGSATITITTSDGSFTDECEVTVQSSGGSGESGESGTEEGSYTASNDDFASWTGSGTGSYSDHSIKFDTTGDNAYKADIFSGNVSSGMTSLTVTITGKLNLSTSSVPAGDGMSYKVEAIDSSGNVLASVTKTGASVFSTTSGSVTFSMDSNLAGCTGIKITFVNKDKANWAVSGVSWSATYSSGQQEVTVKSIAVKTSPSVLTYTAGDDFSAVGLVIRVTFSDDTSADVPYEDNEDLFDFDPCDNLQTSDTSVTISYGGKTCSQSITVNASSKVLNSISVSGQTTSFIIGDEFIFDGVVTAHYSDESTSDVTISSSCTGYDMSTAGTQTVTVTYDGITTTYEITVSEHQIVEKGTADNPYTVAEALAAIDAANGVTLDDTYTKGIICSIDEVSTKYGNATYNISDDGSNTNTLTVFRGKNIDNEKFTNTNQITEGDYVVVKGNLTLYNSTTYEYQAGNYLISRTPASTLNQYSLVTSIDSLKTNDEVMFIGYRNGNSTKYSPISYNSTTRALNVNTITVSNDSVTYTNTYMKFRIVKDGSSFSFATQDGNYLASKSSDTLYLESTLSSNARYSLSLDNTGKVTMVVNSLYFRFNYNYSTSSSRMTAYSDSGTGTPIYIYKKTAQTEADSWASSFLSGTHNCVTTSWATLASNYSSLSDRAKLEIVNCEANASEDYSLRSQAMARYEYILSDSRFNSGLSTFVAGRSVSFSRPNLIPMVFNVENSNVAVIIIISLVSLSTVVGFFFLKSRKKEEF